MREITRLASVSESTKSSKSITLPTTSDAIKAGLESDLLSQFGQRKSVLPKLYGARGGFVTWMIYGPEHMTKIAKSGWEGDAREKRLEKHRRSLAKARAVLKANREAQKLHGKDWIIGRFREKLRATGDPKSALRNLSAL